jgi:hypothetical protein
MFNYCVHRNLQVEPLLCQLNAIHISTCNSKCISILSSLPLPFRSTDYSSVFIQHLRHTCLLRLIARHLMPLIIYGAHPPHYVVQPIKVSSHFTPLNPCSPRSLSAFVSAPFCNLSSVIHPDGSFSFIRGPLSHFPLISNIVVLNCG